MLDPKDAVKRMKDASHIYASYFCCIDYMEKPIREACADYGLDGVDEIVEVLLAHGVYVNLEGHAKAFTAVCLPRSDSSIREVLTVQEAVRRIAFDRKVFHKVR